MIRKIASWLSVLAILAMSLSLSRPTYANVNNFYFDSFQGEYHLSKDENNRSLMKVTETLVAVFPGYDQNHGIERAIPTHYDGHRVFDGEINAWRNGQPENIASSATENGMAVFRLGNASEYVQGRQEYKIEYTLTDVIRISDENDGGDYQELYWNTNGTQWPQVFNRVEAKVMLDDSIADSFDGETACYVGIEGSKARCSLSEKTGNTINFFHGRPLLAYSNLTFAVKFKPDTFVGYQTPAYIKIIGVIIIISLVGMFLALVYIWLKVPRSAKINRAVVPQYTRPAELTNILQAKAIYNSPHSVASLPIATILLDLAVMGHIQIVEVDSRKLKLFSSKKSYKLVLLDRNIADEFYGEILDDIFKNGATEYDFEASTRANQKLGNRMSGTRAMAGSKFAKTDFYQGRKTIVKMAIAAGIIAAISGVAAIGFSESGAIGSYGGTVSFWLVAVALMSLLSFITAIILAVHNPLNEKGAEMKHYLEGLRMYIKLAEADRLRYLQSVQGAERIISDSEAKIKLYEKLLPYAAMFGLEKSWLKVLEIEYDNYSSSYSPTWYSGRAGFNAAVFASSITSFNSSVNTYTAPPSSSSGGSGFGGGGSSGGGGGGGGGGGW